MAAAIEYHAAAPLENSEERPARTIIRQLLNVQRLVSLTGFRAENPVGFTVSTDDFNRYTPATGRYHGRFGVELTRCEIAATLAMTPGTTFQDGSYRLTILDVTPSPREGPVLRVTWSDASSIFDEMPHPEYEIYARNRSRSEAAIGALVPLVVVRKTRLAIVERTLDIGEFPLMEAPPEQAR